MLVLGLVFVGVLELVLVLEVERGLVLVLVQEPEAQVAAAKVAPRFPGPYPALHHHQ